MIELTKVDKVVNDALNEWALAVFQRIEKEHPELLESLLNDSSLLNKNKEAHRD